MRAYSNPERERDTWSLPDIEIFQLTAREAAEQDEEMIWDYAHRHEFRLAGMNSKTREAMFDAMIEEEAIEGGWFYHYCFPGCLPESSPFGPFASHDDALKDARENAGTE